MTHVYFELVLHNKTDEVSPNAVAMWMDSGWSGIWIDTFEDRLKGKRVFRVEGVMQALEPTWLCESVEAHYMCNSIKIHFFDVSRTMSKMDTMEVKRDFLYATSFPASHVTGGIGSKYGVFNYNEEHGLSVNCKEGVYVALNGKGRCTVQEGVRLLSLQGPDAAHHEKTCDVGDWIDITFHKMWPDKGTSWMNPRTFFRDFASTFFYTDIDKLFARQNEQRQLPPWLACYTLANALIVNGTCAKDLMAENFISAATCTIPDKVELVLRIIKDTLAPWTMCCVEGLYWEDQRLGQKVDDQPFPLTFTPSERVFAKDDCEGRSSQAQEMVALLVNMYLYTQSHGIDAMFETLASQKHDKLRVSHTTLVSLVQGCRKIGMLLYNKVLRVETMVGDADANVLSMRVGKTPCVIGHSFGIMLYDDGSKREYMMMENTGWQRRLLKGERGCTQAEVARALQLKKEQHVRYAGTVTKKTENQGYLQLYMGADKLLFTWKNNTLEYGARVKDIDTYGLREWRDQQQKGVYFMTLEQVMQQLCSGTLWPHAKGAHRMLQKYQDIQKQLPLLRRVLAPPQKTESEFEKLMKKWYPMEERSLPLQTQACSGIWMTIAGPHQVPHSHGFMQSTIVNVMD